MLSSTLLPLLAAVAVQTSASKYAPKVVGRSIGPVEANLTTAIEELLSESDLTNQILEDFLEPLQVQVARNSYVVRNGAELQLNGEQWTASGANVYWLGLDQNVIPPAGQPFYAPFNASYPTFGRITEIMNTLQTMGAKTIRSQTLGVSVGNPLSVMPALGVFNEEAFRTIDYSVFSAREHGIRIMAPLIDNYDYYHGGKFDFLRFRGLNVSSANTSVVPPGVMQFYDNATIVQDFKNYIQHLITHVNQFTGLTYAEDPTIFAYETGNELGGPIFGDMWVPNPWTIEISSFIKSLAPHKLVVDGTYGVNKTHLGIETVDIYSDHFYPINDTKLKDDIALVGSVDKVYLAGEYDWTGNLKPPQADTLSSFYAIIEAQQNMTKPVIAGDLFWSLFMHDVPNCQIYVNHSDGYTLQYGNPLNTVQNNTQIATIREHFFAMQNETVSSYLPCVPCPGPTAEYTYI